MEILVLNTNLEASSAVDTLESLLWTDRYCGFGEFEIYTLATNELLDTLRQDYYLWLSGSDHLMIIEELQIKSDVELGNRLIVTGRSLESILNRRIVWGQTILTGNLQNGIHQLLTDNVISPTISDRVIPNFIFEESTDPIITALTVDAQFTWTNLYDTILALCAANNIGFQITLSATNQFIFKLYVGADRSYDQLVNPYVVFSPNFENLLNSNYVESQKESKNVTLTAGEGEGIDRVTTVVGSASALERREMYTDARDLSSKIDGGYMTDADYLAQLAQRGAEDLTEHIFTKEFDGQVDSLNMYKYGEDFFLGDVVQIVNEYGLEAKTRVTEIIHSQSTTGVDVYPTFTRVE